MVSEREGGSVCMTVWLASRLGDSNGGDIYFCALWQFFIGGYFGEHREGHQLAVIARNNHTLLNGIFDILATTPDANIALAGGLPRFKFPTLEDVYYLNENRRDKIKSNQIKRFKTIFDLKENAIITEDLNLRIMISVRELIHCTSCVALFNILDLSEIHWRSQVHQACQQQWSFET